MYLGELYPTSTIALWSIWACCAFALFDLIAGYHSTLYLTIDRSANKNGIVLAVSRVSSALTTLAVSHTSFSVVWRSVTNILTCNARLSDVVSGSFRTTYRQRRFVDHRLLDTCLRFVAVLPYAMYLSDVCLGFATNIYVS